MSLNVQQIYKAANEATKIKFGQTIDEHLKPLFVSSLRAKIPQNFRYIGLVIDQYNGLIDDINANTDSFLLRLRMKMVIEGLHGSTNGNNGIKRSLKMLFLSREFERRKLNKSLVAFLFQTGIELMFNDAKRIDDPAKLLNWKEEKRQYLDTNYLKEEFMSVLNSYL